MLQDTAVGQRDKQLSTPPQSMFNLTQGCITDKSNVLVINGTIQ